MTLLFCVCFVIPFFAASIYFLPCVLNSERTFGINYVVVFTVLKVSVVR